MDSAIAFEWAMARLALAGVIWVGAVARVVPRSTERARRLVIVVLACTAIALLVGPELWLTYDSTVDLALGRRCAEGVCPTRGVNASAGSFEGGVLWDWILGALFVNGGSPDALRLAFVIVHALGAGLVAATVDDARTGWAAGALFFVVSFGLAPGYLAWHPTLAPIAVLPAVLLATGERPLDVRSAFLLGASYGVALGVYIAVLFLGTLMLVPLVRGGPRAALAAGLGLVVEQAVITPEAAWTNVRGIVRLETVEVGAVVLVLALVARRRAPPWLAARPSTAVLAAALATLAAGAMVAGHGVYPFYLGLFAAPLAGAFVELAARRIVAGVLVVLASIVVIASSAFYRVAVESHHEGLFAYGDLHALAPSVRGDYGVAVSSPSYALQFSLPLWAEPAAEHVRDRGLAIWRASDPDPGLCIAGTERRSRDLRTCEYEAWARTEGAQVCLVGPRSTRCRDAGSHAPSLLESPIHYPRTDALLHVRFSVPVCVDGKHERVLEPVVFPALAVQPSLSIVEPTWGRRTVRGDAVRVTADEPTCGVLEWEWRGAAVPLVPWERTRVPADAFEHLSFFVRERAPSDRDGTVDVPR